MKRHAFAAIFLACGTRTTISRCPQDLPGPPFVETSDAIGFPRCIDATEVTNADYLAFLADPNHHQAGVPFCSASDPLEPMFDWPPAPDRLAYPVVNVDWCGAWAYCDWAGKRLCTTSEFTNTCEGFGARVFPYGADYDPHACNGSDLGEGRALPAHALATCEGAPRGVFDMSGNVWEWISWYEPDGGVVGLSGGGFRNDRYNLQCNAFFMAKPTTRYDYYGFRCCGR